MRAFTIVFVVGTMLVAISEAKPHPRPADDPYSPLINFLKDLRKARKQHGGHHSGTREESRIESSGSPSFSSSPNNGERVVINLPPGLSVTTTSRPVDITRVNQGVDTVLRGVGNGSLEQILRGSFHFSRNDNVRSVANTVLDAIFGGGGGGPAFGGGSGGGGTKDVPAPTQYRRV